MTIPQGGILIVAAVSQELQDFHPDGDLRVERLITGMGPRAGEPVRRRLARGGVGLVVSAGFSGGVRPGFRTGDLVMASEVIEAAGGRRWNPAPLSFGTGRAISVGPFVTVERPLSDPRAKLEAGARFGAIAADMETAAVARSAQALGVAWVAVRAILDPMEVPLAVRSRAQALRMLAAPGRWKEFAGFLQTVRTASRSLADGLHLWVEQFTQPVISRPAGREI